MVDWPTSPNVGDIVVLDDGTRVQCVRIENGEAYYEASGQPNASRIIVDDNGNVVADFTGNTPNAVNYVEVNNAAANNGPQVQAEGADTNVDLVLAPKGTGAVVPGQNDGSTLGRGDRAWSDLYLADGGVVNWGNSGAYIAHNASADSIDYYADPSNANANTSHAFSVDGTFRCYITASALEP